MLLLPSRFADSRHKSAWARAGRRWGGRRRPGALSHVQDFPSESLKGSRPVLPMPTPGGARAQSMARYPILTLLRARLEHELAQQRQLLAGVGAGPGGEQAAEVPHAPVLVDGVRGRQAHRVAGALAHLRWRARRGKGHRSDEPQLEQGHRRQGHEPSSTHPDMAVSSLPCAWPASQCRTRHDRRAETGLMSLWVAVLRREAGRVPARRRLSGSPGRAGRAPPGARLAGQHAGSLSMHRARRACVAASQWRPYAAVKSRPVIASGSASSYSCASSLGAMLAR
jgi:hypothetical protein